MLSQLGNIFLETYLASCPSLPNLGLTPMELRLFYMLYSFMAKTTDLFQGHGRMANALKEPQASLVYFVVRDDDSKADMIFQTADTTWQVRNNLTSFPSKRNTT